MFLVWLGIFLATRAALAERQNITIGTIVADKDELPFAIYLTGPAIEMGMEKLQEILEEEANITFLLSVPQSQCVADKVGAIAAEMYYVGNVSAFIGPGCSAAVDVVGRMASYWNYPILTPVGTNEDLGNKGDFKTLTRLAYNYAQLGRFYRYVFKEFNWTDITVMYDLMGKRTLPSKVLNRLIGENLQVEFEKAGLRSTLLKFVSDSEKDYNELLTTASTSSRVFVIACDSVALRELMIVAHSRGMTNGDYVFVYYKAFRGIGNGDISWRKSDENDRIVKKAYESLLVVSLFKPASNEFRTFESKVKNRSMELYNFSFDDRGYDVNPYVTAFYDAFTIYGQALKETIQAGEDYKNGEMIKSRIWNRTFHGVSGEILINANGDREMDMMLLDMHPKSGEFQAVGYFYGSKGRFEFDPDVTIHWPNNKGPPANQPRCGFTGDAPECQITGFPLIGIISIVFSGVILLLGLSVLIVYRRMKNESELYSNWWRIPWEEIIWISSGKSETSSIGFSVSKLKSLCDEELSLVKYRNTLVAVYKGAKVSLFKFNRNALPTTREFLLDLLQLRNINCNNLTKFIGLTESTSGVYAVNEYCTRGDLRDILSNDSFTLNWEFRASLICDIIQAMDYIHSSNVKYHGHLTSMNCVIDSRFVLKVTEFGIQSLRDFCIDITDKDTLLVAPELLRKPKVERDVLEMQYADIYSFGIILYEILSRKEAFEDDKEFLSFEEIIRKLKEVDETPFRPRLDVADADKEMVNLMKACWNETPKARPTFTAIKKEASRLHWDKTGDKFLDNLLSRMEEYANNLEDLVEERTQAFLEEKRRSEELLYQVLPRYVADELRNGRMVDPEAFGCVTIYFSDIVGFTSLSSESTPMQVVDLLNDLYTCFDKIIENYDVYKVETIGDAYMVVSGLPVRNGDRHVVEIARMSTAILDNVKIFKIRHKPSEKLRARIGLHSGPVCAGVVGRKMPRYCLFGDTVNTASRMESNGEAMRIHVSESTRNLLADNQDFELEERGQIPVKGKGVMKTYWLNRRDGIRLI
ncbi:atrial natriuretic peptide receptor 1-like [Saccostrea echinata]|uniref:atrial natriuretic peptide receptor 1-like n=1 Tax=Saccostrea echinata TaxID=191078 RepID=UPI002A80243D|nr:atrial natriuretic peptide receptor 1-like [Saccostrea echinata]